MSLDQSTARNRTANDRLAAYLAGSREPADRVAVLLRQARRHLALATRTPDAEQATRATQYAVAALLEALEAAT